MAAHPARRATRHGGLRLVGCLSALLCALLLLAAPAARGAPPSRAVVELFSRAGCPRCAAAKVFLEELGRERPGLEVVVRDVGADLAGRRRLEELATAHRVAAPGVPAFLV
jgi:hypothetical protein